MKPMTVQYIFLAVLERLGADIPTHGNLSVCPHCSIDDFVHVESCKIDAVINRIVSCNFKIDIEELNEMISEIENTTL